ncbi:MAG: choice-of-anchor O protein [Xanthomonadales bacterium]|nr:choice-of-anchor O protein [Xanthomonadales bacterium]
MTSQSPSLPTTLAAVCLFIGSVSSGIAQEAAGFLPVDPPIIASLGIADTAKVKSLRMSDGALIIAYQQAQDVGQQVYDLRTKALRHPWDVVVQVSIDKGTTWSMPLNIDNTAALSSHLGIPEPGARPEIFKQDDPNAGYIDLASEPRAIAYPGDSGKTQVSSNGKNIIIAWSSKYCPADETRWPDEDQRIISYSTLGWVTIPYSCQYVARMEWDSVGQTFAPIGPSGETYIVDQLTSGYRDAHFYEISQQKSGITLVWQEDPLGLQLGLAAGPGHGASGALTTGGTDLWYSAMQVGNMPIADASWSVPIRLTDNVEQTRPLDDVERVAHEPFFYEYGRAAASRPTVKLLGTRAIVAWEERKVSERHTGKFVRYHTWPDFRLTAAFPMHGCIISNPQENGRRVRVLAQTGSAGDTNILFLYKQGLLTMAGPSDIMMRRTVQGFDPERVTPAIDVERCRGHVKYEDDDTVGEDENLDSPVDDIRIGTHHLPAVNLSGTAWPMAYPGTAHTATTEANNLEDAQAHRGQMRGDNIIVGYSHTPDVAEFRNFSVSIPYNFYVTHSLDGGDTWSRPYNFSGLTAESGITARDPRIVGTPGSGPGCAPAGAPVDPSDCQDTRVFYIAVGTQTNVIAGEIPEDLDVYMGITYDRGRKFSRPQAITHGDVIFGIPDSVSDQESQAKTRPDGGEGYVVWSSSSATTEDVAFALLRRDMVAYSSFED